MVFIKNLLLYFQKEVDSKAQKQIEEISRELQKAEALLSDVQKVNSSLSTAQLEVNTLKAKLQELETYQSSTEIGREVEVRPCVGSYVL